MNKLYMYDYDKPELDEVLEHHGVLGQRWGHKNGPPYPLGSDKSTGKRLKSGAKGLIAKHKAKKVYKKRVQSAEKARQAKQTKAEEAKRAQEEQDRREKEALEREENRQRVIRTGDVTYAKDHADEFSNDEINQIITRYQTNERLGGIADDAARKNTPTQATSSTTDRQTAAKQKAINEGDINYANTHKSEFSEKEINDIIDRYNTNQKLSKLVNEANTPPKNESILEKAGNAVEKINKFAGPMSQLAKNVSPIVDLYSKVTDEKAKKDKAIADKEQLKYDRAKEKEEKEYKRKVAEDETKYKREQDVLDRKERYDLAKTKEEQNQAKKQQQGNNNQQNQGQKKEKNKEQNNQQKQESKPQNEQKSQKEESKKVYKMEKVEPGKDTIIPGSKADKAQKKSSSGGGSLTSQMAAKAAQEPKQEQKNVPSSKESLKNIASNPNTKGALSQLARDLTKNTKTTSGESLRIPDNVQWLAKQSTPVLELMKKNLTVNDSSTYTLQDINKILKQRKK